MRVGPRLLWGGLFMTIIVFAIPWFLWGNEQLFLGLPVWLWWHIGWLGLASVLFWLFSMFGWGTWITDRPTPGGDHQ